MGFWPLLFGVKYVSDLPNSMHLQKAREKQLIGRIKFRISNIYFSTWSSLDWSGLWTVPYLIDVKKQD
jgi:hypothetical protein